MYNDYLYILFWNRSKYKYKHVHFMFLFTTHLGIMVITLCFYNYKIY